SRIYLPGYEHRIDTNETKVYVGDYAVITNGSAGRKVEYLLKDRLGSVDAVASSAGAITETRGYDAFGKPRSGTWADLTPPKLGSTNVTPKGFTQHEHMNQLELIHMNGRVFDYNVGRFTGVDPVIQFPLNSQSLNPYSYILNNPLSGTDPTGYTINACTPDAGSHVKSCDTVTVQTTTVGGETKETKALINSSTYDRLFSGSTTGTASGATGGQSAGSSKQGDAQEWSENTYAANGDTPSSSSKGRQVVRGIAEGLANMPADHASSYDYACESQIACAAGEEHSLESRGMQAWRPYPDPPENSEQQLGRGLAPAVALLPALLLRNLRLSSPWNKNPFERGFEIEKMLGGNLPSNFPTIDRFQDGIATSIKSVDLRLPSYQNAATLQRTLNGYVDKVAAFKGRTWADVEVPASRIRGRELLLAVPGRGTAAQQAAIQAAAKRAQEMGVQFTTKTVP
ncbi:MAG: hypothetical protein E6Q50_17235, partial [Lysobacter sp.]